MYDDTADRGKPRLYNHDCYVNAHIPHLRSEIFHGIFGMGTVFEALLPSSGELFELEKWWA